MAALLLIAATAAAQAPTADARLAIDLPPGPVAIDLGREHDVPFTVTFSASGLVCPRPSEVVVTFTVDDAPRPLPGARGHVREEEVTFPIPAGAYTSGAPAGGAYDETAAATLMVMVGADALPDHEHAFDLTASYAGGTPAGCQGAGPLPAATATASHAIRTGSDTAKDGATGTTPQEHANMTDDAGGTTTPAQDKVPVVGPAIVLLVVAFVAVARRP